MSKSNVDIYDVAPSRGGVFYYLKIFFIFFIHSHRNKDSALYISLSGGLRQVIDSFFILISLLRGFRIFVHHHSFAYLTKKTICSRFSMLLLAGSQHIVLCERMKVLLCRRYNVDFDNVRILSNSAFFELPNKEIILNASNQGFTFGFLSNISPEKGFFEFIALIERLREKGFLVEGLIAGPLDRDVEAVFKKRVNASNYVKYIGPVYGLDKSDFFSKIDLFVFPTKYVNEAEPLVLWEALEAGVPVMASARGCIESMLKDNYGLIIYNSYSFVDEAVIKSIKLFNNPATLINMKKAAFDGFKKTSASQKKILHKLTDDIFGLNNG